MFCGAGTRLLELLSSSPEVVAVATRRTPLRTWPWPKRAARETRDTRHGGAMGREIRCPHSTRRCGVLIRRQRWRVTDRNTG